MSLFAISSGVDVEGGKGADIQHTIQDVDKPRFGGWFDRNGKSK
jgi:hypothetical protein